MICKCVYYRFVKKIICSFWKAKPVVLGLSRVLLCALALMLRGCRFHPLGLRKIIKELNLTKETLKAEVNYAAIQTYDLEPVSDLCFLVEQEPYRILV